MLLLEITCNTDPESILKNIADHVKNEKVRLSDCHSATGNAIANQTAKDNDRLVILGHGKTGAHSIIVDEDGKAKVDTFSGRIKSYDSDSLKVSYYTTNAKTTTWDLVPLKVVTIKEFRQEYL